MKTMTIKQIDAAIAKVGTRQEKNNADIHVLLCHLTMHALENSGDVSGFDRLLAAVKGTDRRAIADWIKDFAPVKFEKETGRAALNKGAFKEMSGNVSLVELIEGPTWLEGVPNVRDVVRTLDLEARVVSLLESLDKYRAEGKPTKNEELESYLRTALLRFEMERAAAESIKPIDGECEVVAAPLAIAA